MERKLDIDHIFALLLTNSGSRERIVCLHMWGFQMDGVNGGANVMYLLLLKLNILLWREPASVRSTLDLFYLGRSLHRMDRRLPFLGFIYGYLGTVAIKYCTYLLCKPLSCCQCASGKEEHFLHFSLYLQITNMCSL